MALFRRRRPADPSNADTTSATSEFWEAWPEVRAALGDAVANDQPAPSEVSDRVTALVHAAIQQYTLTGGFQQMAGACHLPCRAQ